MPVFKIFRKDQNSKPRTSVKADRTSVVTIILIEGKDLPKYSEDKSKEMLFNVRFQIGEDKYKSQSLPGPDPQWFEQFDLDIYNNTPELKIELWDQNEIQSKTVINIAEMAKETTHTILLKFLEYPGEISLVMTISGITNLGPESYSVETPLDKGILLDRYSLKNTFHCLRDIGHLTVKIYRAIGLPKTDFYISGKADPYCVIELDNVRLQTHTDYKTLSPIWNRTFTFNVKDIASVLEITVLDEDKNHNFDFVGKLSIPLLRIQNGLKRWYTLKDRHLLRKAKGNQPQILLEMTVIWNPLRATIKSIVPKEQKLLKGEPKFSRKLLIHNVTRIRVIAMQLLEVKNFIKKCICWEVPLLSICSWIIWIVGCLYMEFWSIPLLLFLLIVKKAITRSSFGKSVFHSRPFEDLNINEIDDDLDDDEIEDSKKTKTFRERLAQAQIISESVQNTIGYMASVGECTKNLFNFCIPELTWLAAVWFLLIFVVVYLFSFRWIALIWGSSKFVKRLFIPNYIPNNEILDFLSRVPTDDELIKYCEIPTIEPPKKDIQSIHRNIEDTFEEIE